MSWRTELAEPTAPALPDLILSILLVAGEPVSIADLASAVERRAAEVEGVLAAMAGEMIGGIRLQVHGGMAQLATAPECAPAVQRFLGAAKPAPLSRPALEVLSIVAYRQPVTGGEIEEVRGVNSDRALQTLLARGLVEERGRRDTLGKPMQYGTGFAFLQYFGLRSLEELPPLDDQEAPTVDIGLRRKMEPAAREDRTAG